MKREEIEKLFPEATKEQVDKVMNLNGADVEKVKGKVTELESELNEKKTAFDTLTADFEELKTKTASADDYKTKFEALQETMKQADAEREAQAKHKAIEQRFNTVIGDKKFTHEAIRKDYLEKFCNALDDKEYTGKSDADILHELTKDDAKAFDNVEHFNLPGGTEKPNDNNFDDAAIRAVMGLPPQK